MLPLLARVPTMRLTSTASLQLLKRTQSIAVNERASNRQTQALIRGGIALVAVGGAGYLLNKVKNNTIEKSIKFYSSFFFFHLDP